MNIILNFILLFINVSNGYNSCNICIEPLRIIVLIDTSSSVGPANFKIAKIALLNLVDSLKINNEVKMGIIQFSTKSEKIIDMSSNITEIKNTINLMKYVGGWTNTKSAILMADTLGKNYWISNTTNILLLITDGYPQMSENRRQILNELNRTTEIVRYFKETNPNVDILSIAIGEYSKNIYRFFRTISDFPVYTANNYTDLSNLFLNLSVNICTAIFNGRMLNKY